MKFIATFKDVCEMNDLMQEAGLPVVVHLRDACAGQSFWLEAPEAAAEQIAAAGQQLREYYEPRHLELSFFDDGWSFTIKSTL